MSKPQSSTDAIALRIQREIERSRVLRRIAALQVNVDGVYERAATSIRKRLRAIQFTDAQVAAIVREELAKAVDALLPTLEHGMREAALGGNDAAKKTYEEIFGLSAEQAAAIGGGAAVTPFGRSRSQAKKMPLVSPLSESEDGARGTG